MRALAGTDKLSRRERALIWFAFAGATAAWSAHFLGAYLYAQATCLTRSGEAAIEPLTLISTAVLAAVCVASGLAGLWVWRASGSGRLHDPRRRIAFMGFAGMVAAAIMTFATVLEGVQAFTLTCAQS